MNSKQLNPIIISDEIQVEERLSALHITNKDIEAAGIAGVMVRLNATDNNTKSGPGISEWDTFNKTLRDLCCGSFWTKYQEQGIEGIISIDKRIRIIPSSGNAATGNPAQPSSNRNPKGIRTIELVQNTIQGSLFNGYSNQSDDDEIETYILLYYHSDKKLKLELSKPSQIQNGKITAWDERIILNTVEFDKFDFTSIAEPPVEDEIDIPIQRIQK